MTPNVKKINDNEISEFYNSKSNKIDSEKENFIKNYIDNNYYYDGVGTSYIRLSGNYITNFYFFSGKIEYHFYLKCLDDDYYLVYSIKDRYDKYFVKDFYLCDQFDSVINLISDIL